METEKTPLEQRQEEVAQYQANIELYTTIAASLPSAWPKHLARLKGSTNKHQEIASIEDLDDVLLVGQLWAHDEAQAAIRAETIEKAKAEAILNVLQS